MSTHARPLAERLAAASDAELTALFRRRGVRPDSAWQDFFDAADALLDPASISRALTSLTARESAVLHAAATRSVAAEPSEERAELERLALLDPDGTTSPPVAAVVASRSAPPPVREVETETASESAQAHAAERAFTTVSTLADILLAARARPLSLLAGGSINAGERRQLTESGVAPEAIDDLIAIAITTDLLRPHERLLRTTARSERWLRSSVAERWVALAVDLRSQLPPGIRTEKGGWIPSASWQHGHPWDPGWPARSASLREQARLLGLIADGDSETAWAAPLRRGADADTSALTALLPEEVDRIFLQNDLSAIAPGPLAPAVDVRLRQIATRESAAQASSYRFTPSTVAHALVVGETEESIIEFLDAISLTGIPQPLRYLVSQTAGRHGLVRVSLDTETGRTRVESTDRTLIEQMAVDQALRPLALTAHAASLTTRVGRETVYWALTDARYPATLIDEDGNAVTGERHPVIEDPAAASVDYRPLLAALRSHLGPDADAAWLDRELEAAVRAKSVLRVSVGMPDGTTRELILEATGLGGGRLRGRDRAADVERTLPVSSIRAAVVIPQ